MGWNEIIGLGLVAFAMTMSVCGAINELTKAQDRTAKALAAIHDEMVRRRELSSG